MLLWGRCSQKRPRGTCRNHLQRSWMDTQKCSRAKQPRSRQCARACVCVRVWRAGRCIVALPSQCMSPWHVLKHACLSVDARMYTVIDACNFACVSWRVEAWPLKGSLGLLLNATSSRAQLLDRLLTRFSPQICWRRSPRLLPPSLINVGGCWLLEFGRSILRDVLILKSKHDLQV